MRLNYATLTTLFSLITTFAAGAAGPKVRWAQCLGGTGYDKAYRLAVDAAGCCYNVGGFTSTNAVMGTNVLVNRGSTDVFLAKFSPQGSNLWVQTAGGSSYEEGRAVTVDDSGNVYITGSMRSDSTFGSTNLLSQGGMDAFLAKYDSQGNVVWVRQAWSPSGLAQGTALCVRGTDLLWAGSCYGSIDVGGLLLANVSVFVCRYNLDGDLIWAHNAGYGSTFPYVYDVATQANGDWYVAQECTSGTFQIGQTTVTRGGTPSDGLVTKWDANGNLLWYKQAIGYYGRCHAVEPNPDGSVDVLGRTAAPGEFAGVPVPDAFLSRITATGSVLWVKSLSTNLPLWDLARDAAGNSFVAAELPQAGTEFCGVLLTNASSFTLPLIGKLDALGNMLWVKTGTPAGTNANYSAAWSLGVASSGAVYLGGSAFSDFDLDATPLRLHGTAVDAFLVRIDPEPPALHITQGVSSRTLWWSTNQTGFVLERSPSLLGTWDVAADSNLRLGDSFVCTNASQYPTEFFRLRLQE